MAKSNTKPPTFSIPSADLWTAPISWTGSSLHGIENYSRDFPPRTVFTRCELIYQLSEEIGPGMFRETVRTLPGLFRLEKMNPFDIYVLGFDEGCWTYRSRKKGRKAVWDWLIGPDWPGEEPASTELRQKFGVDHIIVQSILPAYGSNKHISLMIRDDSSTEDFSKATDPDPNDD